MQCKAAKEGLIMINLHEKETDTGFESANITTCSICGKYADLQFKQGYVCEECLEYITSKINLKERASDPASYLERS